MSVYISRFGAAIPFSGFATGNYTVKISGIPYMCIAGSLTIGLSVGRRSQATFTLYTDNQTHFLQYQPVTIFDQNGTLRFSGYITSPKEQKPGYQGSLIQTITAIDQHYLADKRVIAKIYTNQTCGTIITDIVNSYLKAEGVTLSSVFDGLIPSATLYPATNLYPQGNVGTIPTVTFSYCTVAQALDALVTEASTGGDLYYWSIDQYKKLYFQPYTAIQNATVLDGAFFDQAGSPCTVTRGNPKYRNIEYLTGGSAQTSSLTEKFTGDGQKRTFVMGYGFFSAPTITVNGISQTVGLKGTNATGSQWYWAQGDTNLIQDNSGTILATSDILSVTYIGQYPIVVQLQDQARIAAQAAIDGTSGKIEVVDQDKSIIDYTTATTETTRLVARYGVQGVQLQFTTLVDYGLNPGNLVLVNLPDHGINQQQMLVETVSISDQQDGYNIRFTVVCIQGPYDTTWVSFYSDLVTNQQPATAISVGNATNTPPIIVTSTTQAFTATMPTPVASLNATVTTASSGGGGTYPVITIPSTSCSGMSITSYTTTSDQAIRFIVFKDNDNTGVGSTGTNSQYIYGGNVLLYWADIEKSEGNRNWSVTETAINNWASQGKKAIVRISTCGQANWTSKFSAAQGTPQWVFDAGVKNYTTKNSIVPQYWNSTFVTKFNNFISAFAAKYDGDSRIEFIQVAVGMGGECKPDTTISSKPTSTDAQIVSLKNMGFDNNVWFNFITQTADHYHSAFSKTKLCMIPGAFFNSTLFAGKHSTADIVNYVKPLGFGLQNDGIGGKSSTGAINYTPPDSNWSSAKFISAEQRDPTSQTGDTFECDVQAIISYCQSSKPIYALCFISDLQTYGSILSKYSPTIT